MVSWQRLLAAVVVGTVLGVLGYLLGLYGPLSLADLVDASHREATARTYVVIGFAVGALLGLLFTPANTARRGRPGT